MYYVLLTTFSCKTGDILLSLSLFGKDVATGPRLQRWIPEERLSVSENGAYESSPTSSMDTSDNWMDTSGFMDVPAPVNLRV